MGSVLSLSGSAEVGEEEKKEREGRGKIGRRGSPVKKIREGKEKEKARGKKKRKEHLKQPLR